MSETSSTFRNQNNRLMFVQQTPWLLCFSNFSTFRYALPMYFSSSSGAASDAQLVDKLMDILSAKLKMSGVRRSHPRKKQQPDFCCKTWRWKGRAQHKEIVHLKNVFTLLRVSHEKRLRENMKNENREICVSWLGDFFSSLFMLVHKRGVRYMKIININSMGTRRE